MGDKENEEARLQAKLELAAYRPDILTRLEYGTLERERGLRYAFDHAVDALGKPRMAIVDLKGM